MMVTTTATELLIAAREQFRFYEKNHRDKAARAAQEHGPKSVEFEDALNKAEVNAMMADQIDAHFATPPIDRLRDLCNRLIVKMNGSVHRPVPGGVLVYPPVDFRDVNELLRACDRVFAADATRDRSLWDRLEGMKNAQGKAS